jgi:hypothetical protein
MEHRHQVRVRQCDQPEILSPRRKDSLLLRGSWLHGTRTTAYCCMNLTNESSN